jgi:hypothetical protein
MQPRAQLTRFRVARSAQGMGIGGVQDRARPEVSTRPAGVRGPAHAGGASIVAVADASLSTRCGMRGTPIAATIARSIAALGRSAATTQNGFGLIAVDHAFRPVVAVRPRVGNPHVRECLEAYQRSTRVSSAIATRDTVSSMAARLGRPSLVAVISDFLFGDAVRIIADLAALNAAHDVVLLLVDARFAFACPDVSSGWIQTVDAETGRTCLLSRREYLLLATRVGEWQDGVMRQAGDAGVEVLRIGRDRSDLDRSLTQFVADRQVGRARL